MVQYRTIQPNDNITLANIIRTSLLQFTDQLEGTVYTDPTTDDLYNLFRKEKSIYYIAEEEGHLLGGGGLYPGEGMGEDTVELVKMYLAAKARGKGIGYQLLDKSVNKAREFGFSKVYIESLPVLKPALSLYEKYGFKYIDHPIGKTGHGGCDIWMILDL